MHRDKSYENWLQYNPSSAYLLSTVALMTGKELCCIFPEQLGKSPVATSLGLGLLLVIAVPVTSSLDKSFSRSLFTFLRETAFPLPSWLGFPIPLPLLEGTSSDSIARFFRGRLSAGEVSRLVAIGDSWRLARGRFCLWDGTSDNLTFAFCCTLIVSGNTMWSRLGVNSSSSNLCFLEIKETFMLRKDRFYNYNSYNIVKWILFILLSLEMANPDPTR